jgi:hypothetical protein
MKTATQTPSLQQEMQRLVAEAPSSGKLAEATAELESLRLRRNDVSALVAALEKEVATENEQRARDRVDALLKKREMPKFVVSGDLHQSRTDLRVIEDAILIRQRDVQGLQTSVSVEVRRNLKLYRQPLVARVFAALRELEAIATEENGIVFAASRAGCNTAIGYLQVPGPSTSSEAWRSALRSEGYEI